MPPGGWFTDGHLQEVVAAIGDSFDKLLKSTEPTVLGTPRCTFSVTVHRRTSRPYVFSRDCQNFLTTLTSIGYTFHVRILGRAELGRSLGKNAIVDAASRPIVQL